jgi:hypothetical protein
MAVNMETLLESRLLDELTPDLLRQLSAFIRAQQADKAPVTRSGVLLRVAEERFGAWLAQQDVPAPVVPSQRERMSAVRLSPKLSPPTPFKKRRASGYVASGVAGPESPVARPQIAPQPLASAPSGDDIFAMDEVMPPLSLEQQVPRPPEVSPRATPMWKPLSMAPKYVILPQGSVVASNDVL